jgi:uncharacterized protein (TIGR02145 family)
MKKLIILLAIFTTVAATAQSVGINADGSAANASAMLDVSSTTKGFLPPRMTEAQRIAITTPAQGLMIYCTDCGSSGEPQYYDGTQWKNLIGGTATTVVAVAPTITTTAVSSIGTTTASSGGVITADGGASVTQRGLVWSTSTNPTIALSTKTEDGTGTGTYTSALSGLIANTTYYVRAYATNSAGTGYGAEVSFATLPPPTEVVIGTQTWKIKNLDVTTYSDGTAIPEVTNATAWAGLTTGAWCYYNNITANGTTYGKLYNWYAVAGIHDTDPNTPNKILAPTGYHIPSNAEWTTLTTYLGGETVAGGKMKATTLWRSSNTGATNSSGFTGLPGGDRNSGGTFNVIGDNGYWWSSTEDNTTKAWNRYLYYNDVITRSYNFNKTAGFSVRCLRD